MTIRTTFLLLVCGGLCLPLSAQFRSEKRAADKAFELSAYNLAIEGYRRALDERPDDPEALARIAESYRMLGALDTARQYYARAMGAETRVEPATLLGYAQTLKSLGEYALARPLFAAYASEADQTVGQQYVSSIDFALAQQSESAGYTVSPFPFNSPQADFGPAMPGPDQLVFNSSRIQEGFDGVAQNRPYLAQRNTLGNFEAPVPLSTGYLSRGGNAGPVSFSPDGTLVVFTRNTFTPGTRMVPEAGIRMSLMLADVNQAGMWSNVRPLPFNGDGFSTGFGTFGAEGRALYFASDRPGGFGGYDLYRARLINGNWEAVPENLGPAVNAQGNEITPYYDGSSLYFSSDWHAGLGAYDVFRAEMNDAGRPTTLYHLGSAVNSPRDDMGFVYDAGQRTGYLTSNRSGGQGAEDLYVVKFSDPLPTVATSGTDATDTDAIATGPQSGVPQGVRAGEPVPFGTVRGYVSSIQSSLPLADATVTITKRSSGQAATVTTDTEGAYYVEVEPRTVYDVNVALAGYESISFPVTTEATTRPDAFGNILLLPIQTTYDTVSPPAPTVEPTTYSTPVTAASPPKRTPADSQTTEAPSVTAFSVQIASVASAPDLAEYSKLAAVGPVFAVQDAGNYKVRIGQYSTREAAAVAAREIKDMGYAGSFIVSGPAPGTDALRSTGSAPATAPAPAMTATAPATATATVQSPYRVQLGAFSKPENFDRVTASQLGSLGQMMRGALTVFYLDGLQSLSQAEGARNRALAAGYSGAYILRLEGDSYVKE
ncbi:hypothetical protein LEM8419_01285 [Neolewinella maritima]|uniref:SPOR domain-containing protein n=1 Tax=Neolewinella maritima TaxID=1383882 RepID=A0ABM9B0H8_9BACT|nr:SPOR domain-containing protein [Neolewinella maritima]CAH1000138.1 hypothetical protein LEM8419_01285 [Neolewinella maritima]